MFRRRVFGFDCLGFTDLMANPEFLNWDVFHSGVVYRIIQDLDGGKVVTMKWGWALTFITEFTEEVLDPFDFRSSETCSIEFGLRG